MLTVMTMAMNWLFLWDYTFHTWSYSSDLQLVFWAITAKLTTILMLGLLNGKMRPPLI
jgi:hypothetical protein